MIHMNNKIKFFLFIADEVLMAILVVSLLIYFHISLMITVIVLSIILFISLFIAYIFLPQLKKPLTGVEGMQGMKGTSMETLDPFGKVQVRGEIWDAESLDGRIEKEAGIIVENVQNLHLYVRKHNK